MADTIQRCPQVLVSGERPWPGTQIMESFSFQIQSISPIREYHLELASEGYQFFHGGIRIRIFGSSFDGHRVQSRSSYLLKTPDEGIKTPLARNANQFHMPFVSLLSELTCRRDLWSLSPGELKQEKHRALHLADKLWDLLMMTMEI